MARGLEKRPLGRTGLVSTFIRFGALEIGRDWGLGDLAERQRPGDAEAGRVLNSVLDLGVNLIDTAARRITGARNASARTSRAGGPSTFWRPSAASTTASPTRSTTSATGPSGGPSKRVS